MSNKIILRHALFSFIFISAAGSLLHFVYEWTGQNRIAGYFSAVNESTWEHMKLMFVPVLVYAIFLYLKFRTKMPAIFPAFALSSLISVFLIPVLFYTYTGVLGSNVNFLNLLIFYVSAASGCTAFYMIAVRRDYSELNLILLLSYAWLLIMFIFFTYNPPSLGIFASPEYNCLLMKK